IDSIGIDKPRGDDRVLRLESGADLSSVEAQLRELRFGELDVNTFILRPYEVAFLDLGHSEELLTDVIGNVLQLRIGETFAGDRVENAIGVAKFVVEKRAGDAGWQERPYVGHLLPHLVPELRQVPARQILSWIDVKHRFARL